MGWEPGCVGCGLIGGGALCRSCRLGLIPAADRRLASGLLVRPAWRHQGPARRLVLALKYGAMPAAARLAGEAMAGRLPPGATTLVPVPRARVRAWRHGVDPAAELARALASASGLPLARALAPAWWWPAHAGAGRSGRAAPRFRAASGGVAAAVLVDDVLTTGTTLTAAARVVGPGVIGAVTATAAGI